MSAELAVLAGQAIPYVSAAASAYGGAVLARTQDQAADATVAWGQRLLQRLFGTTATEEEPPEAVADLAAAPEDPDVQAAMRLAIRKALAADAQLAAEITDMLGQAEAAVSADGNVVQAGDVSGGRVYGGDHVDFSRGTFHGPVTGKG
ncbi:hypothetical protein PS9374_04560 [Planomonospora sphaerica]|uniref:Uncharacterized protein n=1 Tax=Planomonospora sphaerica TaxID=161355 RepID=A0A161LN15_9ACTN|nr:hypothetical protein [Planomonospora sphaerica]GAT68895.1 hypothetical protein PS9374_04560 [Planomonospora sphaerica]